MKLLKLKITDRRGYKSLFPGFEVTFRSLPDLQSAIDFNPFVIAGMNGSGKSNILEALAEIFFHLDCINLSYRPPYFDRSDENIRGFDPAVARVDEYELSYCTFLDKIVFPNATPENLALVSIVKTKGERPILSWVNEVAYRTPVELSTQEVKSLLPEYILGYSSGDNESLSFPFIKSRCLQYDEYLSGLEAKEFLNPRSETSLLFFDEYYTQAILLTNFLMLDHPDNISKTELHPFRDYVGIEDVDSVRIVIRTDIEIQLPQDNGFIQKKSERINLLKSLNIQDFQAEKIFVSSFLEKLKRCATTWYEEDSLGEVSNDISPPTKKYLYLDYKVTQATKEAFQFHFENNAIKLFELFKLLLVLDSHILSTKTKKNIYSTQNIFLNENVNFRAPEDDRVMAFKNFRIKKRGVVDPILTKELSDGEHQFLHTLGLCILYKQTRSLFLLDEPETHFNLDWRSKFITALRYCFRSDNLKTFFKGDMLITTHSPYLISDSDALHVLAMIKNELDGRFKVIRPDFQTLGASINKISMGVLGAQMTIGDYAVSILKKIELRYENGEDPKILLAELEGLIGESLERKLLEARIRN